MLFLVDCVLNTFINSAIFLAVLRNKADAKVSSNTHTTNMYQNMKSKQDRTSTYAHPRTYSRTHIVFIDLSIFQLTDFVKTTLPNNQA